MLLKKKREWIFLMIMALNLFLMIKGKTKIKFSPSDVENVNNVYKNEIVCFKLLSGYY